VTARLAEDLQGWEPGRVHGEVFAHQGGWDEALFVAVPMLLFIVLLWIAKRRAEAEVGEEQAEPDRDDR
jgi:hypothetical protein